MDNTDAVYQFDNDPALSPAEQELNDAVVRVAQTPNGRVEHGMANVPVVNGTPRHPGAHAARPRRPVRSVLHGAGVRRPGRCRRPLAPRRPACDSRRGALRLHRRASWSAASPTLSTGWRHGVRPPGDDVTTRLSWPTRTTAARSPPPRATRTVHRRRVRDRVLATVPVWSQGRSRSTGSALFRGWSVQSPRASTRATVAVAPSSVRMSSPAARALSSPDHASSTACS